MSHLEPSGELALLALRYAAGELVGPAAEAFEERLATDGAAREALGETVRLSAAVSGIAVPTPRPGLFAGVQDRLFPTTLRGLFPARSYRGHPAVWVGLGSLAAGLFALTLDRATDPTPQFVVRPMIAPSVPATPPSSPRVADSIQATTPVAGMEPNPPTPQPMPQPAGGMPPLSRLAP